MSDITTDESMTLWCVSGVYGRRQELLTHWCCDEETAERVAKYYREKPEALISIHKRELSWPVVIALLFSRLEIEPDF